MVFFVFNLILRYEQSVGTKHYLDKLDFLTMEILLEVYIKSDPDIRLQQPTILYNHQIGHMSVMSCLCHLISVTSIQQYDIN